MEFYQIVIVNNISTECTAVVVALQLITLNVVVQKVTKPLPAVQMEKEGKITLQNDRTMEYFGLEGTLKII